MTLSKVLLVFKTHLDIGFTDTAANVTRLYFESYIPQALKTARELRQAGSPDRFIWTTGSWLIYEYLEQAEAQERSEMEESILAGDIAWHGLPFTTHSELMDESLFQFGLSLSQTLDRRFGKQTLAAKMSDVPGHTRGIVPLLAAAGIQFLHIGVNLASTPPDVPPVFRWQSPDGSEIMVMYGQGYGSAASAPGQNTALAFGHTIDNLGPQTPAQVQAVYAEMRAAFPGAEISAATLDDFARTLLPVRADLPVITAEIGDTWIHGAGSDPLKLSRFRALQRLRSAWLKNEKGTAQNPALTLFSRKLILIPEHTWGMDEKTHLADWENYSASKFQAARALPNFEKMEASWAEQRATIDQAVSALEGTPFADEARAALSETRAVRPDLRQWQRIADGSATFETRHFTVRFDSLSGALNVLKDKASGRDWAGPLQRLGLFRYQTFSEEDYQRFFDQYIHQQDPDILAWAIEDYSKRGMAVANPEHRWWLPQNVDLYRRSSESSDAFLAQLSFPSRASGSYGCPQRVGLEWVFPKDVPEAHFTLQWFEKHTSRLPEALWLSFVPRVSGEVQWQMDKLGQTVSPLEVVSNGSRKLHAVGAGVALQDGQARLCIQSLDAALLAPGEPSLLNFNNDQPDLKKGMHFNLYNNIWGTNFPMWYGDDAKFRFILK